jgi:acetyl/propionyl-CoA carboxylase alpha subunit
MKTTFKTQTIEINPSSDGYVATIDDENIFIKIIRVDLRYHKMELLIDNKRIIAHVSADGAKRWVTINGETILLTKTSGAKQGIRHDHAGGLTAPMPGQVRSVNVKEGDDVTKGQTLLTMEAMKMEIKIQALMDGKVKSVFVSQGDTVEREQILIEMEN